jgi:hypothetical protein
MIDIKTHIDEKLSGITVSSALSEAILDQTVNKKAGRPRAFAHRWIAAVAAISLMLACSFTVFASSVPVFNDWLYRLNPQLAEYLYPIQKSDTDNGIKVEVLSAINDNHNAVVYFTVQDLTDQNRVDEKLDICDTCDIDGPFIFNVEMISYDSDTKTALFVMRGSGGEGISNRMTTFQINRIMSGKTVYDWFDTGINLEALTENKAKSLPISEFGYNGGSELPKEGLNILEPDAMSLPMGNGINFVTISNIGFVNSKLHIQTKWETSFDNHGDFRLTKEAKASNAQKEEPGYSNYYFRTGKDSIDSGNSRFAKHIEYVFDVDSREELKDYRLWVNLVKDGTFTEGDWKVNFRMSDSDKIFIEGNRKDERSVSIEVSSIGTYIKGYRGDLKTCDLSIIMRDGTRVVDYSRYASNVLSGADASESGKSEDNNTESNIGMMFHMPVDLKEIRSIALDGFEIYKGK